LSHLLVNGEEIASSLVLFDVDGTLVDDEDRYKSLAALRFDAIAVKAGMVAAEMWAPLGGYDPAKKTIDMAGPVAKAARREDVAIAAAAICRTGKVWHEARTLAEAAYMDADTIQMKEYTPRLFPGVEASLRSLKEWGLRLGIATNGPSKITNELLNILKIRGLFSVVVGSEDVVNPKPSPDLLLTACANVNASPLDAVYVGDQPVDAEAAVAAGFKACVIVGQAKVDASPFIRCVVSVADIHAYP
jgi:phosphoglycolate phosphatase